VFAPLKSVYLPATVSYDPETVPLGNMEEVDGVRSRRPRQFIVVHSPRVAVRRSPSTSGELAGSFKTGEVLSAASVENGWVRLQGPESRWVLIDGTSVGLGQLLEPIPIPDEHVVLRFLRPDDGQPMYDVCANMRSTVSEVRQEVCQATGLKEKSMLIARGKMGQRIADSQDNLYKDHETVYECGFTNGDEVGYMYLGDPTADLASFTATTR